MLASQFYWSLKDIDDTDIESLIPFLFESPEVLGRMKTNKPRELYADDVTWL